MTENVTAYTRHSVGDTARPSVFGLFSQNKFSISPYKEIIAYEYLWSKPNSSVKTIAEKLSRKDILPSEVVEEEKNALFSDVDQRTSEIRAFIDKKLKIPPRFSVLLKESPQYPEKLLDAKHPIDLFYYRGNPDLVNKKCVSIVGTRQLSDDGVKRTQQLIREFSNYNITIVSGLARGADTIALHEAIRHNLSVVGVIGTPIDRYYPRENRDLQELIASEHLLISQVPFFKYENQPFETKKIYFVERDATMAAVSDATVIVEASDTSGTLKQAQACIEQGRKLFILNSCFENQNIKWPAKYEKKGAIRVRSFLDILANIGEM
ncbi:MAG: DNA-protecting protein DprA [Spirochaetaceae bacterium]|nr:DNA-protecting protein DprA [Spirochaetaceae bacterium]